MIYFVKPIDHVENSRWNIVDEAGIVHGEVQRLATGFLATRIHDKKIVKRYRMIDALTETFGDENEYEIPKL